jgi:hypothetical protein
MLIQATSAVMRGFVGHVAVLDLSRKALTL